MDSVSYSSPSNIAAALIVPHAVFSVFATIAVAARLHIGRAASGAALAAEEYVCIAALVANHFMLITEGVAVPFGLGTEATTVARTYPGGMAPVLKCIMAIGTTYGIACPLSKLAVLAMYCRVFSTSKALRISVWVLSAMVISWGIAVIGVTIFACVPVQGFCDKSVPSRCLQSSKIGITVPNIAFDVAAVLLPLREVWHLRLKTDKKLALASMFLFGSSVVAASIARPLLFHTFRPGPGASGPRRAYNITQTIVFPYIASAIEICLAIIAACLPPCLGLFRALVQGGPTRSVSTDGLHSAAAAGGSSGSGKKPSSYTNNTLVTIGRVSKARGGGSKHKPARKDIDREGSFERLEDGQSSVRGSTEGLCVDGEPAGFGDTRIHVCREVHVEVERGSGGEADGIKNWVLGDIALNDMSKHGKEGSTEVRMA